jgi:hypothetical protein
LTPAWNFANRLGGSQFTPEALNSHDVIPARAGIQFQAAGSALKQNWVPAGAGMTLRLLTALPPSPALTQRPGEGAFHKPNPRPTGAAIAADFDAKPLIRLH